jgi:hypothetical protein
MLFSDQRQYVDNPSVEELPWLDEKLKRSAKAD